MAPQAERNFFSHSLSFFASLRMTGEMGAFQTLVSESARVALAIIQVQTTPKHGTMQRMNELTNQIERLQGRVHETMVRL